MPLPLDYIFSISKNKNTPQLRQPGFIENEKKILGSVGKVESLSINDDYEFDSPNFLSEIVGNN